MTERKSSFLYDDLLACGRSELFGPGNAQLPLPPMLMFDCITHVSADGEIIYTATDLKVGRFQPAKAEETPAMRRVVVTGIGIVSSIGNNSQEVLASLREAKSGIVKADDYVRLGFRCQVHGAPNCDLDQIDRRARTFHG